jgi:signal peptidase I
MDENASEEPQNAPEPPEPTYAQGSDREPWLAVNLSYVFPGLGQIYAGRRGRGWAMLVLAAGATVASLLLLLLPSGRTELLIGAAFCALVLTVGSPIDAYFTARGANSFEFEAGRAAVPDPWRAMFLSRIIPGLGYFVLKQRLVGVLAVAVLLALSMLPDLLGSALSTVFGAAVVYHCYRSGPDARRSRAGLAIFLVAASVAAWTGSDVLMSGFRAFRVPSVSMEPTLERGDYLMTLTWGAENPARGDVVVFDYPQDRQRQYVKRVIGLPGDRIEIRAKRVFVNGVPLAEPYAAFMDSVIQGASVGPRDNFGPYDVGHDEFFCLGDNRDLSNDSRFWGPVPRSDLIGRAYKIYWPSRRVGPIGRGRPGLSYSLLGGSSAPVRESIPLA